MSTPESVLHKIDTLIEDINKLSPYQQKQLADMIRTTTASTVHSKRQQFLAHIRRDIGTSTLVLAQCGNRNIRMI